MRQRKTQRDGNPGEKVGRIIKKQIAYFCQMKLKSTDAKKKKKLGKETAYQDNTLERGQWRWEQKGHVMSVYKPPTEKSEALFS